MKSHVGIIIKYGYNVFGDQPSPLKTTDGSGLKKNINKYGVDYVFIFVPLKLILFSHLSIKCFIGVVVQTGGDGDQDGDGSTLLSDQAHNPKRNFSLCSIFKQRRHFKGRYYN